MTDWKLTAEARRLPIPPEEIDRLEPVMEALERDFRALTRHIASDHDAAAIFSVEPRPQEGEER